MANLRTMLSTLLDTGFAKGAPPPPMPAEDSFDRVDCDLVGLSDADAMWYFERRKWRGRD